MKIIIVFIAYTIFVSGISYMLGFVKGRLWKDELSSLDEGSKKECKDCVRFKNCPTEICANCGIKGNYYDARPSD
jgi:hypothetical protein